MGLLLCKCCCCCFKASNSVGVLPEKHYKVLLLGLVGSGKTEIGHVLSQKKRLDYDSSNGVQYYEMQQPEGQLSITEIGGNEEMQKIWHHYFVTTMGIIYCFDMSANYDKLRNSFELLRQTLSHPFVRGKPILLVATKSDLANEGVQLYDIENAFQLDALAKYYSSSIRLCCYGIYALENSTTGCNSLIAGISWLYDLLVENYHVLRIRVKCDGNMKTWQKEADKLVAVGRIKRDPYQRFKKSSRKKFWRRHTTSGRIRPHTAPPKIFCLASDREEMTKSTSVDFYKNSIPVPTNNDALN